MITVVMEALQDVADDAIRRACEVLRPVAQDRGVAFLLNDRPDLAAETGCDGAHVGQQDTPYAQARALLGAERIVGVTCHASQDLALDAAEAGADYVAFGAFVVFLARTANAGSPQILKYGIIACIFALIPYGQPIAVCIFLAWMLIANNALQKLIHHHAELRAEAKREEASEPEA